MAIKLRDWLATIELNGNPCHAIVFKKVAKRTWMLAIDMLQNKKLGSFS